MTAAGQPLVAVVVLAGVVGAGPVFPCEVIQIPPTTHELRGAAAVSGHVVAHVADQGVSEGSAPAPGVLVRIEEELLPAGAHHIARVVLLTVDAGCNDIPQDASTVESEYPIGTRVAVVGRLLADDDLELRIVTSSERFGHLSRVPADPIRTTAGALDFNLMRGEYEGQTGQAFSRDIAWRNRHRGWFEDYEYLRALLLLASAAGPEARVAIAANLVDYGGWRRYRDSTAVKRYRALLKLYEVPRHHRGELMARFRRAVQPEARQ